MRDTNDSPICAPAATPFQRRAMRMAIVAQCFGCLGSLVFSNNLLLLYLTAVNAAPDRIVIYLALPMIADAFLRIPLAYVCDRRGKKLLGLVGLAFHVSGFAIITGAGWFPAVWIEPAIVAGAFTACAGQAAFSAGWFALLSPIVPESERGRFFGRLRLFWQGVGIAFAAVYALALNQQSSVGRYQVLLAGITVATFLRAVVYTRLPELEKPDPKQADGLTATVTRTIRGHGYMSFCSYVFLLSLFTVACPSLFGLIEKNVVGLGDAQVAWVGNIMMIGAVAGFALGGRAVDRLGTKPVFLACHFGYGAVLFFFVARAAMPGPVLWAIGAARFLFGMVAAASSIAISTELLALIPPRDKSVSTSVCLTLSRAGGAFSGLLSAWVLRLGMLKGTWTCAGATLSSYDTLLLACAVMVVALTVTLGLVPSVIGKAQWVPEGDRRG